MNHQKPLIVGILNVTPDSFSDGGQFLRPAAALAHARKLVDQGADFIDVGAEATNPWAEPLTPDQEWQRLEKFLPQLAQEFPEQLSLDTYHVQTARRGLEHGISVVNDVTMFRDPQMMQLAVEYANQARFIIGHLAPSAKSVAEAHKTTPTTSVGQVKAELLDKRQQLIDLGVPAERLILDPDIGFGKDTSNNFALHWQLLEFAKEVPGIEVMIGHSRKRFLGENRLEVEPNLQAARRAIASGARYLRVHDVAAHRALVDSL